MVFDVITIFPELLESYLKGSLLGRARDKKIIKINFLNLRDFTLDKHKTVDDSPYGGGPGMVLKIGPIYRAIKSLRLGIKGKRLKSRIILFSTRGKKFDGKIARRLSKYNRLILICGRYEGTDERVARHLAEEEISVGDFVLSGGELAALILIETASRYIPGVLGKKESLEEIKGSYPVYTRPEVFLTKEGKKMAVPKILLSGNHKKIEKWRKQNSFDTRE